MVCVEVVYATLMVGGVLWFKGRLCVPRASLIYGILSEAHVLHYSIYSGTIKMYHDLRQLYWWLRMKRDIVNYVPKCQNYQ